MRGRTSGARLRGMSASPSEPPAVPGDAELLDGELSRRRREFEARHVEPPLERRLAGAAAREERAEGGPPHPTPGGPDPPDDEDWGWDS